MQRDQISRVRVGDRVIADGHRVGDAARIGEVVEVLGEAGHERCRIQWEDGHETLVYPGADIRVEHRAPDAVDQIS
jgi:hypothetical protein